jgi:hypothetical protein
MPTTPWVFKLNSSTDFTSSILSASITQGREKYLDNYPGGTISITINNNTNLANSFNFNDKIYVENTTDLRGFQDVFTVQEITFNDYPGNTGLSTATIFAVDGLARAGRYQAVSKALTQTNTYTQLIQFNSSPLPGDLVITSGAGSSTASAQTYTGTVLNQINVTQSTERGLISTGITSPSKTIQVIYPIARNEISGILNTSFTFGRNTSATVIAYNTFERIQNGLSFINNATISPLGLAEQTRTNTASVTAYGEAFYSSTTVDYTTTQAQGNGDWIVNTFSDIEDLRFRIGFTDRMQNSSAYTLFLNTFGGGSYTLAYREPAAVSDTTVNVVLEGWTIDITPEQTTYSLSFSPLDYYQFFTLNSSTLGILDTSRLGW